MCGEYSLRIIPLRRRKTRGALWTPLHFTIHLTLNAIPGVNFLELSERVDLGHIVEGAGLDGQVVVIVADAAGNVVPEALLGLVVGLETFRQVEGQFSAVLGGPVADAVHVVAVGAALV